MALRDLTPAELSEFAASNDASLKEVDAPNNTVFDEKSGRVLSLPQTLNAHETNFVIDKDIDGKKGFFGQSYVGLDAPPPPPVEVPELPKASFFFRGLAQGVAQMRDVTRGLDIMSAEAQQEPGANNRTLGANANPANLAGYDFLQAPDTPEEEKLRLDSAKALEESSRALIKRNAEYIRQAGFDTKDANTFAEKLSAGLGSGIPSIAVVVAGGMLTKNPMMAAAFLTAQQESASYLEADATGKFTPAEKRAFATSVAVPTAALEYIGGDLLFKAFAGNNAIKRLAIGAASEGTTEGLQGAEESAVANLAGVRNDEWSAALEDIGMQALVGGILGGSSSVLIGHGASEEAKSRGVPADRAEAFGRKLMESYNPAVEEITAFIDKELAPIAHEEESAAEFIRLMQSYGNNQQVIDPNKLSAQDRKVFDQYIEIFNKSTRDTSSVASVEKAFFEQSISNGLAEEEAVAASKLLGARADAASRALGITPMQWYEGLKLEVQRQTNQRSAAVRNVREALAAKPVIYDRSDPVKIQKQLGLVEKPKSVLQYIRSRGGISMGLTQQELGNIKDARKRTGDTTAKSTMVDAGLQRLFDGKKGKLGSLLRERGGYGLDQWFSLLKDAGYAVDTSAGLTEADAVMNLIEQELNGEPVYNDVVEEALANVDDTVDRNRSEYERLGITSDMTDAEITRILERASNEDSILFQSAYHGSPYNFDKFTLSHIGRGEGAQAYGWGLYFAGNKQIAEFYRGTLSAQKLIDKLRESYDEFSDSTDAINSMLENNEITAKEHELLQALKQEDYLGFDFPHQAIRAALSTPENYDLSARTQQAIASLGQLYQVKIPEDDVLLHWDQKLADQPTKVKEALESVGIDTSENMTAAYLVNKLTTDAARNKGAVGVLRYNMGIDPHQAVSEFLNQLGIKGTKYLDAGSRTANQFDRSYNYVIFDDQAIDVLERFYQDGKERGSITFGKEKTLIELFENADPSTLLHELGHLFLRDMRSTATQTNRPMVKKDYQIIKDWIGAKGDTFTVAQEEKFARGFEAYLREGKAPTEELSGVFERFKEWLTAIYKSIRDLDVKISDDVRQVFDRMLGGDFARTESILQKRDASQIEQDYEIVAEMDRPSSLREDTASVFRDIGELASDMAVPVSTRLGKIDQSLKHAIRRFMFDMAIHTQEDRKTIKPFIEGVTEKLSARDYRILDLALKNRDTNKVDEIMKRYGLTEDWKGVRETLDKLYNEASEVGLDMGYIEDYFPRKVKNDLVLEYMADLRNMDTWTELQIALKEEDPRGEYTPEEQAAFANKFLRGYSTATANLTRTGFSKERKVDYVKPEWNHYYQDSMQTLMQYIAGVRRGIEERRLFGKDEKETEDNIGSYVLNLIDQGVIKPNQEKQLKAILKAVVNPQSPRGFPAWAKNASYIYLMGSPISAITQIQDLAFSLAFNGYYRTAKSVLKTIAGKQNFRKEDLGIDNILQEYEDETRANAAVRRVFKLVGLEKLDAFGKEVYIEAALGRLQAANKKGGKEWSEMLQSVFGDEAAQVKKDLKDGTRSENVKYLLFSELSDVQPISLAEMPLGYLRGGNYRILYQLKTYLIKQFDIYRRSIFSEIASGEPARMVKGTRNLIHLSIALGLLGMTSDALKDLILGRKFTVDDLFTDNLLKLMGISKYQIYKSKTDGIANAFFMSFIVPPAFSIINDTRDLPAIAQGKKEAKDAYLINGIPVVGKVIYWWWGGGRAKELKKRKKAERNS